MKIESVYDNGGNLLGDEYINLVNLQEDTKLAVSQIVNLDECAALITKFSNSLEEN